jgi:hypothetical protein
MESGYSFPEFADLVIGECNGNATDAIRRHTENILTGGPNHHTFLSVDCRLSEMGKFCVM